MCKNNLNRKQMALALVVWVGALLLLPWDALAAPATQQANTIVLRADGFSPALLRVPADSAVTWRNTSDRIQTLASFNNMWEPVELEPGASYTRFFEATGNYDFFAPASVPGGDTQQGTLIVESEVTALPATPTPITIAGSGGAMQQGAPDLMVLDQPLDAQSVTVSQVSSNVTGYLVIHESGTDGQIDLFNTLGHTPISAGESLGVTVTLQRMVPVGTTLYAALHQDMGTLGQFEYPGVDEVLQANGQLVARPFRVQAMPDTLPVGGGEGNPEQGPRWILVGLMLMVGALLLKGSLGERA